MLAPSAVHQKCSKSSLKKENTILGLTLWPQASAFKAQCSTKTTSKTEKINPGKQQNVLTELLDTDLQISMFKEVKTRLEDFVRKTGQEKKEPKWKFLIKT